MSSPAPGKASEMRSTSPGETTVSSSRRRSESVDAAQIVAIQVQQVEGEIDHRRGAHQVRHGVGVGVGDARLDEVKARDALLVEHRDFAIEHRLAGGHVVVDHGQLRDTAARSAARCAIAAAPLRFR